MVTLMVPFLPLEDQPKVQSDARPSLVKILHVSPKRAVGRRVQTTRRVGKFRNFLYCCAGFLLYDMFDTVAFCLKTPSVSDIRWNDVGEVAPLPDF